MIYDGTWIFHIGELSADQCFVPHCPPYRALRSTCKSMQRRTARWSLEGPMLRSTRSGSAIAASPHTLMLLFPYWEDPISNSILELLLLSTLYFYHQTPTVSTEKGFQTLARDTIRSSQGQLTKKKVVQTHVLFLGPINETFLDSAASGQFVFF